jgi:hypothetical protein
LQKCLYLCIHEKLDYVTNHINKAWGIQAKKVQPRSCPKHKIFRNDQTMHRFANEPCIVLIISDDLMFPTRTWPAFSQLFLWNCKIAACSFISQYCCYMLPVSRDGTEKWSWWELYHNFYHRLFARHTCMSQNFIVTFWLSPSNHHHWTTNKLFVVWRWWLQHCFGKIGITCIHQKLPENPAFFSAPSNHKCYCNIWSSTLMIRKTLIVASCIFCNF